MIDWSTESVGFSAHISTALRTIMNSIFAVVHQTRQYTTEGEYEEATQATCYPSMFPYLVPQGRFDWLLALVTNNVCREHTSISSSRKLLLHDHNIDYSSDHRITNWRVWLKSLLWRIALLRWIDLLGRISRLVTFEYGKYFTHLLRRITLLRGITLLRRVTLLRRIALLGRISLLLSWVLLSIEISVGVLLVIHEKFKSYTKYSEFLEGAIQL